MTVRITFASGDELNSQEESDRWAEIETVEARRTASTVGVEDKPIKRQRAHITADVVLERGVERLLEGTDWCGAWRAVARLWDYLGGIAQVWQEDEVLGGRSKRLLASIASTIETHKDTVTLNFRRGGADLEYAWYTEPVRGTYSERKSRRTYFDHEPQPEEVPDDYQAAKWEPNLATRFVRTLEAEVEEWIRTRVRLPWTSLDTGSSNSSDKVGIPEIEAMIAAVRRGEPDESDDEERLPVPRALSRKEAQAFAAAILTSFDFCPPSMTGERTPRHAGAVAARHVVEHFMLHPGIREVWRDDIAAAFLPAWRSKTQELLNEARQRAKARRTRATAKRQKTGNGPGTGSAGLESLLGSWTEVTETYEHFVRAFAKAALP